MAWAAMNDAIYTILSGVSGVGVVHKYRRYATEPVDFRAFYAVNNVINAWEISRTQIAPARRLSRRTTEPQASDRTHRFTLFGYHGIADAQTTELTFQQIIENIADAFRGEPTLQGTAEWAEELQAQGITRVEFFGIPVHHAELTLDALERIDP
jgi:hypothetical protein